MILQLDDSLDGLEDERRADVVLLFLGGAIVAHTVLEDTGKPLVVQRPQTVVSCGTNARPATAASLGDSAIRQVVGAIFQLDDDSHGLEAVDRIDGDVL